MDPWQPSPGDAAELDSASAHTGRFAGRVTKERGYLLQRVGGLLPHSTYTVRAWVRVAPGSSGYLYVKGHGRPEIRSAPVSDTAYTPVMITFTMGRSRSGAEVGVRSTAPRRSLAGRPGDRKRGSGEQVSICSTRTAYGREPNYLRTDGFDSARVVCSMKIIPSKLRPSVTGSR
jgi:hypothetical protein